jgi:signal transduction histidine kinase/DNA-binding response OmpR family regulator
MKRSKNQGLIDFLTVESIEKAKQPETRCAQTPVCSQRFFNTFNLKSKMPTQNTDRKLQSYFGAFALKQSLVYAKEIKYTVAYKDIYKDLSDNYADLGNKSLAYDYLTQSNLYRDSLFTKTQNRQITEIENKFYVKEKEIENELLKSEQAKNKGTIRQRTILGIGSVLILILVSILAIVLRRSNAFKSQQNELLGEKVQSRTQELLTANQELDEAKSKQLLASAKFRFFANVSHELRTPLTLIQAPLEASLNSGQLDNKNWTRITRALQSSKKLNELVSQIMDLTKFEANKLQLNETTEVFYLLIRRTIAAFESYTQQKGIKLSLYYEPIKDLQIEIDKEKFERILTNFLSNAIKFTPKGGSIRIVVKDLTNQLQLSVIDTGIGIHAAEIERVFERYYQANYNQNAPLGQVNHHAGSTGIGLSLCADYAKLFDGKVWAESQFEGQTGSVFYFEFPKKEVFGQLTTAAKVEVESSIVKENGIQKEAIILPIDTKKDRILVVEDNYDLRHFMVELLSENYEIIEAEHGQEALDILKNIQNDAASKLPSLIVSDVMMPIVDGFELLKQLKLSDDFRHLPVMMLTARSEMKDKLNALRIGVDDYVLKPFHEVELKVRIKNLIHNFQNRITAIRPNEAAEIEQHNELKISESDTNFLVDLENLILKNIDKNGFTAADIADLLLMSRAKLFRKIKELTSLTLNQYITEVRLQKAKELLENKTVNTVKEVTFAIGFKQSSYFSKIYEDRFGRKPSDYL